MRFAVSPILILCCSVVGIGQEKSTNKRSAISISNTTDSVREVKVNGSPTIIKAKTDVLIEIPPGKFTYQIVGVHDKPLNRNVDAGDSFNVTIRSTIKDNTIDPHKIIPEKKVEPMVEKKAKPMPEKKVELEQETEPKMPAKGAVIVVKLPRPDCTICVDGEVLDKKNTMIRYFQTPNTLKKGQSYYYKFSISWQENGTTYSMKKTASFYVGQKCVLDFTFVRTLPPIYSTPVYGPFCPPSGR